MTSLRFLSGIVTFVGCVGDGDETGTAAGCDEAEVCDGIDNDCDGLIDDADDSLQASDDARWYPDSDQDGYGTDEAVSACVAPEGHVDRAGDCDDTDPDIYPQAREHCTDVDHDCDGEGADVGRAYFVSLDGEATDITASFGDPKQADLTFQEPGTVHLCEGTYVGTFQLFTPVSIIGQSSATTILSGQGLTSQGTLLSYTLDGGDDQVTISGLTITEYGGRAVYLEDAGSVSISDLLITEMAEERTWAPSGRGLLARGHTVLRADGLTITEGTPPQNGDLDESIHFLEGATASIEGLSLVGCGWGWGIQLNGSTLSLSDATISGCTSADDGAAIWSYNGVLTVSDSSFSDNHSLTAPSARIGGAIYAYDSTVSISDSSFSGNSATYGGAFGTKASEVSLSGVTMTDNIAANGSDRGFGGAIYARDSTSFELDGGVFIDNFAQSQGGGLYLHGFASTLSDVTFDGNAAEAGGDIVHRVTFADLDLVVTDGNFAEDSVDSIYLHRSEATFDVSGQSGVSFTCSPEICVRDGS